MVQELVRPKPAQRWLPESAGNKPDVVAQLIAQAEKEKVRFVNLQFTDLMGIVKSVAIPLHQFEDACINGKWFDGSSIEGFTRIAESDMFLVPDLSTWAVMPWEREEESTARAICWVYTPNGELFEGDPRMVLARALDYAANLGYKFNTGPELEFFLFKDTIRRTSPARRTTGRLLRPDRRPGRRRSQGHGERARRHGHQGRDVAPRGGARASTRSTSSMQTPCHHADNAVTFKYTLKAIAAEHGLHCTFMPKPIFGINGSGMHTHQSFADIEGEKGNLFADAERRIRPVADRQAVHRRPAEARARHVRRARTRWSTRTSGWCLATRRRCTSRWARVNRSALIRVPQNRPGQAAGRPHRAALPGPDLQPVPGLRRDAARRAWKASRRTWTCRIRSRRTCTTSMRTSDKRRNIKTLPGSLARGSGGDGEGRAGARDAGRPHNGAPAGSQDAQEWNEFRMRVTQWETRYSIWRRTEATTDDGRPSTAR